LLQENGLSAGLQMGGAAPSLSANSIQLNDDKNPARMGQQIAQAVYGGIGK
jgi:hypothetical protein